jgi:hypothetical protein
MTVYKKDPNAVLDYTFDWGPYLTPLADTIASAVWVLPASVIKVSQLQTTTTASAFLSGGTLGETETVTCRITTNGGRTDDRSIQLKIVER